MKQIVFFGDSNTWGHNPETGGGRYPFDVRFTGLLTARMPDCHICEEGVCGRTALAADTITPFRSGLDFLACVLNTHSPIDLLVIMLGTNDTKPKFCLSAGEIARGVEEMLRLVRSPLYWHGEPVREVLVVSPIEVGAHVPETDMGGEFDETSVAKSKQFAAAFADVAKRWDCHFLDAAKVTPPSDADAIHLDKAGHRAMADALEAKIREILK
jgi:lysophospholipase L1-like esterase